MIAPWLESNQNQFPYRKLAHVASLKARIGWQALRTDEFVDEGPFCVTGTDFQDGKISWTNAYHVSRRRYDIDKNIQLRNGDLLVTKDGTIGKVAVVDSLPNLATLNSGIFVVRPRSTELASEFLKWVIFSRVFNDFISYCYSGSTINHLYQNAFERFHLPFPDNETQRSIANFLDTEISRIDLLIEKLQRLQTVASKRIEALVDVAISDKQIPWKRFESVARVAKRAVKLTESDQFVRLGLYNRGRGVFRKPAVAAASMGESSFFWVHTDDLILSGQFAWEGAVALASGEENGCVVSHRYPVYVGRRGVSTSYLLGFLRSNLGSFFLNEASRGAAGRNRPLNTWRLGKEKIPVPNIELQESVKRAVRLESQLNKSVKKYIDRVHEFRSALITAAVTGQIKINSWRVRGETDRRMEQLEESTES